MVKKTGTVHCSGYFCSVAREAYNRVTGNVNDGEELGAIACSSLGFIVYDKPEVQCGPALAEPTALSDEHAGPLERQASHRSATSQHTLAPGEFGDLHSETSRPSKLSVKTILTNAPSMGPEAFPDDLPHGHGNGHVSKEHKWVQEQLIGLKDTLAEVSKNLAEEKKGREDAEAEAKKLAVQDELDKLSREAESLRERLAEQKKHSGCCALRIGR